MQTQLIEYDFSFNNIMSSERIGLGKNAIESGTDKLHYRFYIEPNDIREQDK